MECIILAGGLGTRLRGIIGEQPKCMAPVNGRPFLYYLFQYLVLQGCNRVVLSLGYKHEAVTDWYQSQDWPFTIDYVVEQEPLGTGGGIRLALEAAKEKNVIVLNGDTLFRVSLGDLLQFHELRDGETTLALKPMRSFERYGSVQVNDRHTITGFEEKKFREAGLINGGVYVIDRIAFLAHNWPDKFSFEKDYLQAMVTEGFFSGYECNDYFIDIGIPEDYEQALGDFKEMFG